ncbi:MAG: disulfide bond formation protein [Verrucomicrobiaceae bacterium]|nr:disulfide bond formation protein [Verrucomicrobiaceae bacterium]
MGFALQPRSVFGLIVIAIIGLFSFALYTQYVIGLDPCPLCMTQRVFYVTTAVIAAIAAIHNRHKAVYGLLVALSALAGAGIATRQVWLQHLPPNEVPACGPSLEYMLQTLPFGEVFSRMLKGDGNCAIVDWRLLGLSMAEWSLLCFLFFIAVGVWQAMRRKRAQ